MSKNNQEKLYQLSEDGVTMIATDTTPLATKAAPTAVEVRASSALVNTSTQHAYDIVEHRNEVLMAYGDNPFEVRVTLNVPRRNKVFSFVGKGKTLEEARDAIAVTVRREVSFWRFCIGSNRSQERFPSAPVPYEKQRNPQLYHGGESDVTRATAPLTGQTHPHRYSS